MLEHVRGQDVLVALFSWWFAGAPANRETLRTVMAKINEENRPMRSMLDLVLEMGAERGEKRGEKRGVKKGVLVGQRSLLAEQLAVRFGDLPAAVRERLAAADAASLRAWGHRVLTAPTLAAVFASD